MHYLKCDRLFIRLIYRKIFVILNLPLASVNFSFEPMAFITLFYLSFKCYIEKIFFRSLSNIMPSLIGTTCRGHYLLERRCFFEVNLSKSVNTNVNKMVLFQGQVNISGNLTFLVLRFTWIFITFQQIFIKFVLLLKQLHLLCQRCSIHRITD